MDKFKRSKDGKFSTDTSTRFTKDRHLSQTPNRVRRDAHFLSPHNYHLAAAAELDSSGHGLHPYEEDYATMLTFSICMLILILLTLPLLLCCEHGCMRFKRKRGVRRVVSDAASGNEDYLEMAFSDDFDTPATAETIRFTHNDKEFEIVEQLNKAIQTDPDTNSRVEEIFQRNVPRTQGLANMSKGTATEPQVLRQPELQQPTNNNKQQQTNHDLAERVELKRQKGVGSSHSKTAMEDKSTGSDYDPNISTERCYYTRPVQEQRSVGEQFESINRDNGVQACIYDMISAENKCQQTLRNTKSTKKTAPVHQDQRIISECCMLKTGISTRFQPAASCNTICPRSLPTEPSMGHLNICREDFRTLSRCANLTWPDIIERTENRCTSSSNDENYNQQCCRRPDNNYEPNLSDNCPVQRYYACRVPSERDKKSWFSWW